MRNRYYGHKDKNHLEIKATFLSYGFSVMEMSAQAKGVDLIVSKNNQTAIIEIKRREKEIGICQLEQLAAWKGYAAIICDSSEVSMDFEAMCLTSAQKTFLANFCVRERFDGSTDTKEFKTNRILNLLAEV